MEASCKEKKRLLVDMDGTLARFHDEVNYLERMFEKDFFKELLPFDNMVAGIRLFMQEHPDVEVYIVSSKVIGEPPYCEEEKNLWLDRYLPEIDKDHRIFTDMGRSKADYIPGGVTKNDFLLDDYNRGLNLFLYDGGSAIKCHNNINQRGLGAHGGAKGHMWVGPMVHTMDEPELVSAGLAQCMDLEYDLDKVLAAYPEVREKLQRPPYNGNPPFVRESRVGTWNYFYSPIASQALGIDPLNSVRALSDRPDASDFLEYVFPVPGKEVSFFAFTNLQLRAVCAESYPRADYLTMIQTAPDAVGKKMADAMAAATKPIVGQVLYFNKHDDIMRTVYLPSLAAIQEEEKKAKDLGLRVEVEFNVPLEKERQRTAPKTLSSLIEGAEKQKCSGGAPKSGAPVRNDSPGIQ